MRYFEKVSYKSTFEDVEDHLGTVLPSSAKKLVATEAEKQYHKRLGLRHPFLTGLPTLGLWPLVSLTGSNEEIGKEIFRRYPKIKNEIMGHRRRMEIAYASAPQSHVEQNTHIYKDKE